jgi:hypothetical protein
MAVPTSDDTAAESGELVSETGLPWNDGEETP